MRRHEHKGQSHSIMLYDRSGAEIAFCDGCGFESDGEHCSRCCAGALLGCDEYACYYLLESTVYADEVRRGIRKHWSAA